MTHCLSPKMSLSLYFSWCFSSFTLMSVCSTLFVTLLSLFFSQYLSMCVSFLIHLSFVVIFIALLLFSLSYSLLSVFYLTETHIYIHTHTHTHTHTHIYFCHHFCLPLSYPTFSLSPTFPPTFYSSPTPSNSQMKGCKHVFHMQSHCAEPMEQNNHA